MKGRFWKVCIRRGNKIGIAELFVVLLKMYVGCSSDETNSARELVRNRAHYRLVDISSR